MLVPLSFSAGMDFCFSYTSRTFFSLRRRRSYGSRHPAPVGCTRRWVLGAAPMNLVTWGVPSQQFHCSGRDDASQFLKTAKPCGCTVSTMVLSATRGLLLFRVGRGGIGLTQ